MRVDRSKYQTLRVGRTIQQAGASPFASTLRPNLTGGALPRSSGGYGLGGAGKARHFSHTTSCQAQVVHNVGNGIRAFVVGGGQVRYDGTDPVTGEKRFRKVTATQDQAYKRFDRSSSLSRGTSVEFKISPTITALSPLFSQRAGETTATLQSPEFLSTLSGDFARSLRSLSQILSDLQRLSNFGDLPISMKETPSGPVLIVRFPGCDADLVGRLCDEVGVTRGVICEDSAWQDDKEVQMALLFPFAPNDSKAAISEVDAFDYFDDLPLATELKQEKLRWRNDLSSSHQSSILDPYDRVSFKASTVKSPALHSYSPSGYESLEEPDSWTPSPRSPWNAKSTTVSGAQDFEGVEGIYNFIQLCNGRGRAN